MNKKICRRSAFILLFLIDVFGSGTTLRCWHCIDDSCDGDPSENNRAQEVDCVSGQMCQKVYFRMEGVNEEKEVQYTIISTVRSCSLQCVPQNDFKNCSEQQITRNGCVRRDCCSDTDLCNTSSKLFNQVLIFVALSLCLISYGLVLVLD